MRPALLALALIVSSYAAHAAGMADDLSVTAGRPRAIGETVETVIQVRNAGSARVEVAEVSCSVASPGGSPVGEAASVIRNIKPGATVTGRNFIGIAEADGKTLGAASCRIVDAR
jgi:hypothetical protein